MRISWLPVHSWPLPMALASALLLCGSQAALAQPDPTQKPTYGAVSLNAGFRPDPYVKRLTAGGVVRTYLGDDFTYVAKNPDLTLNYTKGPYPLIIRVNSTAPTNLLVQLPDGKWLADDDGKVRNPLIRLRAPQSGRYQIWVGTYAKRNAPADLYITEQGAGTLKNNGREVYPQYIQLDPKLKSVYGGATLTAGITPDPFVVKLTAGGPVLTSLGGVSAYVTTAPSYTLYYPKDTGQLKFLVESAGDTTVLIQHPNGTFTGEDDTIGKNPLIHLKAPTTGRYLIWVGTFAAGSVPATLKVSQLSIEPKTKTVVPAPKTDKDDRYAYLTLNHEGAYIARFFVSWKEKGLPKTRDYGRQSPRWKTTLKLPRDATDIRVHAQAAVFIGTWRDIYNGPVTPGSYRTGGTTFKLSWLRN